MAAAELDDERDAVRAADFTPSTSYQIFKSGVAQECKEPVKLKLTAASEQTTGATSKRVASQPLELSLVPCTLPTYKFRALTGGLSLSRVEGQDAVGGWTDTTLEVQKLLDPAWTLSLRGVVPAHGKLGSSQRALGLRLIHRRTMDDWTPGLVLAAVASASHQEQGVAGVSNVALVGYLGVEYTMSGKRATWTLDVSHTHRDGRAHAKRAGLNFLGRLDEARLWTLEVTMSRALAPKPSARATALKLARVLDV